MEIRVNDSEILSSPLIFKGRCILEMPSKECIIQLSIDSSNKSFPKVVVREKRSKEIRIKLFSSGKGLEPPTYRLSFRVVKTLRG